MDNWIEQEEFKGWDPYDALNSPLLANLTLGSRKIGQFWVQVVKHCPINLRPLLKISKGYNPKAMGLFLSSYLRKYLLTNDPVYLSRVHFFSEWLSANVSHGYHGACWGYNFDWPNRGFFAPAGTPTIVNTGFIGLALLDLKMLMPDVGTTFDNKSTLKIARGACDFILKDLNLIDFEADEICLSYTPLDKRCVHNANLLGAQLLAEVGAKTQEENLIRIAEMAARYTARRQNNDGSWWYGEAPYDRWIDNFHTGFVLTALQGIGIALDTREFLPVVDRGYAFWKRNFFAPSNAPKYYPTRLYPIDIHNAAQAILTFLAFANSDTDARCNADRIADWAISNMQAASGYFHFQIHLGYRIRIPYMRWSQAWMQRALTELQWRQANENLA